MKQFFAILFLVGIALPLFSQSDTITVLDKVVLVNEQLQEFSTGQQITTLTDSVITNNQPSLTALLNYNTPIYFKENGAGMVSSASFRGTTASQTAVLWNGININSQFNGQTDFNTINPGNFTEINVRPGGGSIAYGTGAIGGTIHLDNTLSFKEEFSNQFYTSYGSFQTTDVRYLLTAASKKWSTKISVSRNDSKNDYSYPEKDQKNENGQFYNTGINASIAYKLNSKNTLALYSWLSEGERHFSLIRPSETKTKYQDSNARNILEWTGKFGKFESKTQAVFLAEEYRYIENIETNRFTYGNSNTWIGKHQLSYTIRPDVSLQTILLHNHTEGEGSNIPENKRDISAAVLLFKHHPVERLHYELAFRQEYTQNYQSPFLYSLGINYQAANFYTLKANISKNFRIPTYNDLYWAGSGNTELSAEKSMQYEIGNEFLYKNWSFSLTAYYNGINDMIRWLPSQNGVWVPENVDEVETYGMEAQLSWKKLWNQQQFEFSGNYAYTRSKNKITQKQLIYVPYHKATATAYYQFKNIQVDCQYLFNGEVFTRSDNNADYNLESYGIFNLGLAYQFGKQKHFKLGGKIRNLFDKAYENVENRWMPGINYTIYLTLNI